jgi:hypothetical protein
VLGIIDRVCEASAAFCKKLEARSLQQEFEEKQRRDPRNWSPLRQQLEAFKAIKERRGGPHEESRVHGVQSQGSGGSSRRMDADIPGAQPAEGDVTGCAGSCFGYFGQEKLSFIANESFGTAPYVFLSSTIYSKQATTRNTQDVKFGTDVA